MRYPASEKLEIIRTVEQSHLSAKRTLDQLGIPRRTFYRWYDRYLDDFMAAYNFARRLKTLSGLTPYEYIAKIWTSEPDRFIVDPIHQMPGLNT